MIGRILPLLLPVMGLLAGGGAGFALRPHAPPAATDAATEPGSDPAEAAPETAEPDEETADAPEYARMNNQFVVPVLQEGRVVSMVILSLSIQVPTGGSEQVYEREPKLRDSFLQVLFDHANSGGFRGDFTDSANLVLLRRALLEAARDDLGDTAKDVLITEIVRQDS